MKNILVCFLFIILSIVEAFSQTQIDSLRNLLKNDKEDSGKVDHLLALSEIYSYQNSDSAILFAEQAKKIAEKIKDKGRMVDALSEMGWNTYVKADYPKALDIYLNALKLDEEILKSA